MIHKTFRGASALLLVVLLCASVLPHDGACRSARGIMVRSRRAGAPCGSRTCAPEALVMKSGRLLFLSAGMAAVLALFWYAQTTLYRQPVEKALVDAVKSGNMSMVQLLLSRGADPRTQDAAHIGLATWALVN